MKIPSQLLLPLLLAAAAVAAHLILPAIAEQRGLEEQQKIARPGCREKCGEMSIPFPFGMVGKPGSRCFLPGFEVKCKYYSSNPPRAFLAYNNVSGPFQRTGAWAHRFNSTAGSRSDGLKDNWVEVMDISVADNEARVYSGVSSDCRTNATHSFIKLQYTSLGADDGPLRLSMARNVLVGVGSNVESMLVTVIGETGKETTANMPSCLLLEFAHGSITSN
jgi:hypothetical protein